MKRTLITISCPGSCDYEKSIHLATSRLHELQERVSESDPESIEEAVLGDLYDTWNSCPTCKTQYDVEIGTTVNSDGPGSVEVGP